MQLLRHSTEYSIVKFIRKTAVFGCVFSETGSLYIALACLGTHYVDQAVLELRDLPTLPPKW